MRRAEMLKRLRTDAHVQPRWFQKKMINQWAYETHSFDEGELFGKCGKQEQALVSQIGLEHRYTNKKRPLFDEIDKHSSVSMDYVSRKKVSYTHVRSYWSREHIKNKDQPIPDMNTVLKNYRNNYNNYPPLEIYSVYLNEDHLDRNREMSEISDDYLHHLKVE